MKKRSISIATGRMSKVYVLWLLTIANQLLRVQGLAWTFIDGCEVVYLLVGAWQDIPAVHLWE